MSHPHIVPVYELGVVDGVYFLAMEYVHGATLTEILKAGGPLAPELVAHVGAQVCDALHYAHTRFDLVHRDITPRNVIVDGTGHSRLLDFGIAAPAGDDAEAFGSPGYMSPEQYEGTATRKGDLFALGAVLYEAFSGKPAFLRASEEQTREAVMSGEAPRLPEEVPEELAEVIAETLSRDPDARPASAEAMGRRLRGWLAKTHPQGVGPELGERVDAARETRLSPAPAAPSEAQPGEDKEPSRVVRTLATSPMLEAMLEGQAPVPGGDSLTVPIERAATRAGAEEEDESEDEDIEATRRVTPARRATEDSASGDATEEGEEPEAEPSTAPIEGAGPRKAAVEEPGDLPSAAQDAPVAQAQGTLARPRESSPLRRMAPIAVALAAGAALAIVLPRLVAEEPVAGSDPAADASTRIAPADSGASQAPGEPEDSGTSVVVADPEDSGVVPQEHHDSGTAPTAPAGDAGRAQPRDTGPPAAASFLTINSTPWANVTLDARPIGHTPIRSHRVSPGQHTIVFTDVMGRVERKVVRVDPGQTLRVFADLNTAQPVPGTP